MANTKNLGENQPGAAGVIWDASKGHFTQWFITWHNVDLGNLGNYRVWITSFNREGEMRTFNSLQLQRQGHIFDFISDEEKRLRLELAAMCPIVNEGVPLNSEVLRKISTGKLLESHSRALAQVLDSEIAKTGKSVRLVEGRIRSSMYIESRSEPKISIGEARDIRSSSNDAILLARIYCHLGETGTSKLAKRTAELLGIHSSLVYTAVRIARSKQWMTKGEKGIAGGRLTELGEKILRQSGMEDNFKRIVGLTPQGKNG